MLKIPNSYFASINTSQGFQNDFASIFDPTKLEKIYILKGGPGTGKSSLMKSVLKEAESKGLDAEAFLCSSDPNSLDGVLLPSLGIAIIDGTAPHTTDPKLPGVVENIVNLGSFWDKERLKKKKREILDLIREKSRYYKRAYQFLSSYGEIVDEIINLADQALLADKMEKNIRRQAAYFFKKENSHHHAKRNIETVCREGLCTSDAFATKSKRIWMIEDHLFASHLYLKKLLEVAKDSGQNVVVSTSPHSPSYPNALYFPDARVSFLIGSKRDVSEAVFRFINMKRFLDHDLIARHRQKIKFGEKCLKMLLQGAVEAFGDAAEAHGKLERYYIDAMDFRQVEETRRKILSELLEKT